MADGRQWKVGGILFSLAIQLVGQSVKVRKQDKSIFKHYYILIVKFTPADSTKRI